MRAVTEIPIVEGIPILVRTALNVPLANGQVTNDFRLRKAIPTIEYLAKRGGRVVLISHIGEEGTETLEPVARALGARIPNVSFCPTTVGAGARDAVRSLSPGHVLVLENLRRDRGEVGNTPAFAHELSLLADVFVQDSFDTCHRPHASIIGIPRLLPSYAGLVVEAEVRELSKALRPTHPSFAIIGGSKFSTKEPVLSSLLSRYDHVFAGGALSHDFMKANGQAIGKSLSSPADEAAIIAMLKNPKLVLPVDSLVVNDTESGHPDAHDHARVTALGAVGEHEMILDHGPATRALLADQVAHAKTVLWNGPLGKYEEGFVDTTHALAHAIAESKAYSVLGGGDTIAVVEALGLLDHFSFVSTGGGAMLDFLADGTLPGIAALG